MNPNLQAISPPRIALMNANTVYKWADGTLFNGFILIQLIPPVGYTQVEFGNIYPTIALPLWQIIPIQVGQANPACGCFLNSDITPTGSVYNASYYDATKTLIAGPTSIFTVLTQDALTPPLLTLTNPTTPGTPSTPD
jgi:hypothetical protein